MKTAIVFVGLILYSLMNTYLIRAQLRWRGTDTRTIRKKTWQFVVFFWLLVIALFIIQMLYRHKIIDFNELLIIAVPIVFLIVIVNRKFQSWLGIKNH